MIVVIFFACLLRLLHVTQSQTACKFSDSIPSMNICYRLNLTSTTWNNAKAMCAQWGGALAMVNSPSQISTALQGASPGTFVWFGANDIEVEGTWVWDHSQQPVTQLTTAGLWSSNEPSSMPSTNDCGALLVSNSKASAKTCMTNRPFLCMEMPLFTTTTASTTTTTKATTLTAPTPITTSTSTASPSSTTQSSTTALPTSTSTTTQSSTTALPTSTSTTTQSSTTALSTSTSTTTQSSTTALPTSPSTTTQSSTTALPTSPSTTTQSTTVIVLHTTLDMTASILTQAPTAPTSEKSDSTTTTSTPIAETTTEITAGSNTELITGEFITSPTTKPASATPDSTTQAFTLSNDQEFSSTSYTTAQPVSPIIGMKHEPIDASTPETTLSTSLLNEPLGDRSEAKRMMPSLYICVSFCFFLSM